MLHFPAKLTTVVPLVTRSPSDHHVPDLRPANRATAGALRASQKGQTLAQLWPLTLCGHQTGYQSLESQRQGAPAAVAVEDVADAGAASTVAVYMPVAVDISATARANATAFAVASAVPRPAAAAHELAINGQSAIHSRVMSFVAWTRLQAYAGSRLAHTGLVTHSCLKST